MRRHHMRTSLSISNSFRASAQDKLNLCFLLFYLTNHKNCAAPDKPKGKVKYLWRLGLGINSQALLRSNCIIKSFFTLSLSPFLSLLFSLIITLHYFIGIPLHLERIGVVGRPSGDRKNTNLHYGGAFIGIYWCTCS